MNQLDSSSGETQLPQSNQPPQLRIATPPESWHSRWYSRWGKRCFDLVGAVTLLIVLLPIMACVGLLVAWRLGRPVLFRQRRSGKDGVSFSVIKFRTMTDGRDEDGNLLPDEVRLTSLGKLLRASSVDEFPQLFNVLRGEMSLVGPRPLLTHYVDLYSPQQKRRLEVVPGVTGRAQVNGRNAISWEEKFEHDVWYVDNMSLLVDLQILMQTVVGVVNRAGISSEGHATAPEFTGSPVHSEPAAGSQVDRDAAA